MATTFSLFQQNNLIPWWHPKYLTQDFNNRNELGQDFGLPLSTPVASISAGRVVYAQPMQSNPGSSVGYIVQVENADGSLFHYQHLRTASVHVGDYVRAGQVLGFSGGCPANGYGQTGCRYTDQYTTGPHIEVRYSPKYDAGAGAWGQRWVNPANAFAAYGGQNVSAIPFNFPGAQDIANLLATASAQKSSNSSSSSITIDPLKLGDAIGQGFASGLGNVVSRFTAPAQDVGVRAFLLVGGFLATALGLFMLGSSAANDNDTVRRVKAGAAEGLGAAVGGEAGAQAAKAIVPPFGDERRAQEARVREERRAALPGLPKPQQAAAALPGPKAPAIAAPSSSASSAPALPEPDVFRVDDVTKRIRKNMDKSTAQPSTDALVREVGLPDTPRADPNVSTRAKQILKRIQADENKKQQRRVQDVGRRARSKNSE